MIMIIIIKNNHQSVTKTSFLCHPPMVFTMLEVNVQIQMNKDNDNNNNNNNNNNDNNNSKWSQQRLQSCWI